MPPKDSYYTDSHTDSLTASVQGTAHTHSHCLSTSPRPLTAPNSQGIGKTLNSSYNFSEVATPYAQELLQLQDGQQQGFIIEQLQQQATEVCVCSCFCLCV